MNSCDDTPITPPPLNSPRLLHQSQMTVNSTGNFPFGDSGNWIVAYGYANREEYKELERILTSYGSILNSKANANWFAIKYGSQLAAEKALCSQPIILSSNKLCGTVRGSPQLLQTLRAQQPHDCLKSADYALNAARSEVKGALESEPSVLSEEDILAQHYAQDEYDCDRRHADSICERMLAWLFGWDKPVAQKSHTD